jgi:hypothetical protein
LDQGEATGDRDFRHCLPRPAFRRDNAFGLLMSLNMLIEFGDAFDYSGSDFASWCREAGFRHFEIISLTGPSSAAVAYK